MKVLKETLLTLEQACQALDAVEMLEHELRGSRGELRAEYPLVFQEGAPGRLVVARDGEGAPLAGCALLDRTWHLPQGSLRAGMIGSVATRADQRGRGLASRVLQHAEEELARRGCAFALLWADDPSFYERRGYGAFGSEMDFLLPPASEKESPLEGMRPGQAQDLERLHALHARHPIRIERTLTEMEQLLAIEGAQVWVLERSGLVEAYVCEGKGRDLQGVIHEWAGEAPDVARLAEAALARSGQPGVLLAPASAAGHCDYFGRRSGWRGQLGILGMGKRLRGLGPDSPLPEDAGASGEPFAWGLDSI